MARRLPKSFFMNDLKCPMMYEICMRSGFSAAHRLWSYKGKTESLHGHNWAVEARITAEKLDGEGMVMDFVQAKECLDEVLDELDHRNLNDLPLFAEMNPTAEAIAKFIFEALEKRVSAHGAIVTSITLWETPECAAIYRRALS